MSAGLEIQAALQLVTEECCTCHMFFAMPRDLQTRARGDAELWFFCPAGHRQHYSGQLIVAKLEQQLQREREAKERAWAEASAARKERDRHLTERRKLSTRHRHLKERVKNGVCPCCHRSFENLRRHMASQHPSFSTAAQTNGGQE